MGALGSDVAIEAADLALTDEDLRRLPDALAHARRSQGIMRQNFVPSGRSLVSLIPLAAARVLVLAAVVATHEAAEILLTANGIPAGRRRSQATTQASSRWPSPPPTSLDECAPIAEQMPVGR